MSEDHLAWCKKHIHSISPSQNLYNAYMDDADATLLSITEGKWKVIMGYYACYSALYALCMKCGIKCEIHDCTITLMILFEDFNDHDRECMKTLKDKRIAVQYYLKSEEVDLKTVKEFVMKCKLIASHLEVDKIRRCLFG